MYCVVVGSILARQVKSCVIRGEVYGTSIRVVKQFCCYLVDILDREGWTERAKGVRVEAAKRKWKEISFYLVHMVIPLLRRGMYVRHE